MKGAHSSAFSCAYCFLNSLDSGPHENFIARNSILSEYGVLGFELGYSYENPRALVIWEAQFGDFANTAQVMIDQFVSAGEHKWLQQTGLVMLLPHGYMGQGAEHSSCRLERFLQLSDDDEDDIPAFENDFGRNQVQKANWQVMNISTPANYFHALRRQQHRDFRKPMVLASPKNLFRLRQCVSALDEMGPGSRFRRLIPERDLTIAQNPEKVTRLVFCSGKLYYELVAEREQLGLDNVAIVTLEQIAPFPFDRVKAMLEMYPNVDIGDRIHPGNVIWCQEEPKNMGAWSYVRPRFVTTMREGLEKDMVMRYVGRRASASPATGYPKLHNAEQEALVKEALVGYDDEGCWKQKGWNWNDSLLDLHRQGTKSWSKPTATVLQELLYCLAKTSRRLSRLRDQPAFVCHLRCYLWDSGGAPCGSFRFGRSRLVIIVSTACVPLGHSGGDRGGFTE